MNSTNIKVMSEEIQRLKDQVHAIDVEVPDPSQATDGQILSVDEGKYVISDPEKELPATSGASTGDVLGLVGENKAKGWITPYNPPSYSETETATGQKWIDGREIYSIVIETDFPEITATGAQDLGTIATDLDIVKLDAISIRSNNLVSPLSNFILTYRKDNGRISAASITTAYSEANVTTIVYYCKPATPETKVTRKKTTKKGE